MKIKYLSCDGETEVIEEIIEVEFYEYENRTTGEVIQGTECTRKDGDIFVIDCQNVYEIKD